MRLMRTHLALRSTAIIVTIVVLVGAAFLAGAITLTARNEHMRQQTRLTELLDTVENTVGIAAFLGDRQLAQEVANGLLSNRIVKRVSITAGDHELTTTQRPGTIADTKPSADTTLVRNITSPFDNQTVGKIMLVPDEAEIHRQMEIATHFVAALLVVLAACISIGTVAVVVRLITNPITRISARLHSLHAETGEKLEFPRGNEKDEIGRLVGDVNTLIDYLVNILTEERTLRLERELEERKFRAIFDNAETGIFQIDCDGHLVSWNPAFAHFFDIPRSPDKARGIPLGLFTLAGENGENARRIVQQCTESNESANLDIELAATGKRRSRWVNIVLTPIENAAVQGIVNDITERKHAEEAAQRLAMTDTLTGLGNRLGFERALQNMIDYCIHEPQHRFALLLIDLDRFKQVNDTWGHQAGDEVLVQIAGLLRNASRKTDYAARLGGDEFTLLLDGTDRHEAVTPVLENLFAQIRNAIPLSNGESAEIGFSIGVAIFTPDDAGAEKLIRRADEAMYRAKQGGRNTWCFDDSNDPIHPA